MGFPSCCRKVLAVLLLHRISIVFQVSALPHYNITEEIIERGGDRFVIRDNSETPV